MSEYLSTSDAAVKWGIKRRRLSFLCAEGRIPGAMLIGGTWMIPADAEKPADARIKSGKYIDFRKKPQSMNKEVNPDSSADQPGLKQGLSAFGLNKKARESRKADPRNLVLFVNTDVNSSYPVE